MKMESINKEHLEIVPMDKTYKNAEFLFNTPGAISVLSEYQLASIQEVRMHNYNPNHEYNIDGNIISEQEIVGSDGDFYIGYYTEIAYIQLYVPYRCNDFTIVRYRSADQDAAQNEWNSDIKFIICHNREEKIHAQACWAFQCLIEQINEYEWNILNSFSYDDEIIDELDDIEEIEE